MVETSISLFISEVCLMTISDTVMEGVMRSPTNLKVGRLQISDSAIAVGSDYFRWKPKLVNCSINTICANRTTILTIFTA
jgi:hypothetical protein